MRVLVIGHKISKEYLGVPTVLSNLLKGFVKIHSELEKNDIYLTFLSLYDDINKDLTERIRIKGIKVYKPITALGDIQFTMMYLKNKDFRDFDVVHSHEIYGLFPYILKTPTIFTLHAIWWKESMIEKKVYQKFWRKVSEFKLRLLYSKLTKFTALSRYVLEELKRKNFDISFKKTIIIENPVSDEFFNVKKKEEPMILYPASLIPRKNQLGFLKAISMIKNELGDYKIVFTTSSRHEYGIKVRKYAENNNLNVEFLGRVPYQKLPSLYSRAAIVALTSFEEVLPMSIIEALSTGTPVIASNVGGIPYVVQNGITGFICNPHEPKDIAEKLLILVSDKNTRKKMGRTGRKNAEKRWKAEIIAKKYLDLYLEVANQNSAGHHLINKRP